MDNQFNKYEFLKNLCDSLSDGYLVYDYASEQILSCNQILLELTGLSSFADLIGKSRYSLIPQFSPFFPDVDLHAYLENHETEIRKGKSFRSPAFLNFPNGRKLLVNLDVIPVDQKNAIAVVIIRNKTDKILKNKEIKKKEQRFRELLENSYDAIVYFNVNQKKIYDCNQQAASLFGFPSKEEFLKSFPGQLQIRNHKDSLSYAIFFNNHIKKALKDGKSTYTNLSQKENGELLWTEGTVISDTSNPEEPKAVFFIRDITEHQKLTSDLNQIIDYMPISFFLKDDRNNIIKTNRAFLNFAKSQNSPAQEGQNVVDIIAKETALKFHKQDLEIIKNDQPKLGIVEEILLPNGQKRWIRSDKVPYHNHNDQVIGVMIFSQDVTRFINSKLEIEKQNEQLKSYIQSNLQLENFAYIASHDLKTPIRTIVSFTQLLSKSFDHPMTPTQQEYFNFIIEAGFGMQRLIEDLLAFSRINSSEMKKAKFSLPALFTNIKRVLSVIITERQANIHFDAIPPYIYGDQRRLQQLFQNLLSNAIKFTAPAVKPIIHIRCKETTTHWKFDIQDNGIGIEKDYQEKIFRLFRRLYTQQEYDGTGIGLAICKTVVEQHGGEINVRSDEKGTTFYFTIKKEA